MNPTTTRTGLRLAALAVLLLFVAAHALTLARDTAEGFCLQLDPCQTAQEDTQR